MTPFHLASNFHIFTNYVLNGTSLPENPCQDVQQLCSTMSVAWLSISTLVQPLVTFNLFLQFTMCFPCSLVVAYFI